jgi:hypothetical protein
MKRLLFLAIALVAAACTAPAPADAPATSIGIEGKPLVMADGSIDASVQQALTADPAACTRAGGAIQPVCRMGNPMCVITFADAGKSCTDGAQCGSSRCYAGTPVTSSGGAATGQCAANNNPCGCNQRVEDGVALSTLCVD